MRGEKDHFKDNFPNKTAPKKKKCKGQALTSIKTWDDSSSEDEAPPRRHDYITLHHEVTLMIHLLVSMIVIVMMKTFN